MRKLLLTLLATTIFATPTASTVDTTVPATPEPVQASYVTVVEDTQADDIIMNDVIMNESNLNGQSSSWMLSAEDLEDDIIIIENESSLIHPGNIEFDDDDMGDSLMLEEDDEMILW